MGSRRANRIALALAFVTGAAGIYFAWQAQRTATAAIRLAASTLEQQLRYNELSVAPRVFEEISAGQDSFTIEMVNRGLGPAKIGHVMVKWPRRTLYSNTADSAVSWSTGRTAEWLSSGQLGSAPKEIVGGGVDRGLWIEPGDPAYS